MITTQNKVKQITSNAMAGITAGLIVSMVLGLYQLIENYCERRSQINYISDMVVIGVDRVEEARDPSKKLRDYYRLLRGLERVLNSDRAVSRLSFTEQEQLRTAFPYSSDGRVAYLANVDLSPDDIRAFLDEAMDSLRDVPWLDYEGRQR